MELKNKYFRCSCGSEVLAITRWDDEDLVDIAIFKLWNSKGLSFANRIRTCFRTLFKGSPWTDQICLSKEDALKLSEDLKLIFKSKCKVCGKEVEEALTHGECTDCRH